MGKAVLASLWQGFTPAFGVHGAVACDRVQGSAFSVLN